MRKYGRNGFTVAAALLVLMLVGSMPTPIEAQSIPRPSSCSLSLTGQQAWLGSSRIHTCGAVQVETSYRGQDICIPYPGGTFCARIYHFEMRARRVSTGGSVLVAKVNVSSNGTAVPECSFNPGNTWSSLRYCGGSGNPPSPPSNLTLTSVVLFY